MHLYLLARGQTPIDASTAQESAMIEMSSGDNANTHSISKGVVVGASAGAAALLIVAMVGAVVVVKRVRKPKQDERATLLGARSTQLDVGYVHCISCVIATLYYCMGFIGFTRKD